MHDHPTRHPPAPPHPTVPRRLRIASQLPPPATPPLTSVSHIHQPVKQALHAPPYPCPPHPTPPPHPPLCSPLHRLRIASQLPLAPGQRFQPGRLGMLQELELCGVCYVPAYFTLALLQMTQVGWGVGWGVRHGWGVLHPCLLRAGPLADDPGWGWGGVGGWGEELELCGESLHSHRVAGLASCPDSTTRLTHPLTPPPTPPPPPLWLQLTTLTFVGCERAALDSVPWAEVGADPPDFFFLSCWC